MYRGLRLPSETVENDWCVKVTETRGLELRQPFLDRDLVGFVLSLPGETQARRGVPKSLLRDAMQSVLPDSIVGRRWKATRGSIGSAARA